MRNYSKAILVSSLSVFFTTSGSFASAEQAVSNSVDPWNSWYIGIHAGQIHNNKGSSEQSAGWTEGDLPFSRSDISSDLLELPSSNRGENILRAMGQDFEFASTGELAGLHVGRNWRFDNAGENGQTAVLGFEADIAGTNLKGQRNEIGEYSRGVFSSISLPFVRPIPFGYGFSSDLRSEASSEIDTFSTFRGRAGFLIGKSTLLYATGGLAAGKVKAETRFSGSYCPELNCTDFYIDDDSLRGFLERLELIPDGSGDGVETFDSTRRKSSNRLGWTLGDGLEHQIAKNVTLKAEYLAYDLGSISITNSFTIDPDVFSFGSDEAATISKTDSFSFRGNTWRLGLSYHF
jgi:opacity protein-like surface antigen